MKSLVPGGSEYGGKLHVLTILTVKKVHTPENMWELLYFILLLRVTLKVISWIKFSFSIGFGAAMA